MALKLKDPTGIDADKLDSLDSTALQAAGNELSALQSLADTGGYMKKTADGTYALKTAAEIATEASGSMQSVDVVLPIGYMGAWGSDTPPTGWMLCDGTAISRSTYAELFAIIGTAYGVGDGSTTFNLPNLKGKMVVGKDSTQTEFDTLGESGGAKTVTLDTTMIPSHTHVQDSHNHTQNAHGHTHSATTFAPRIINSGTAGTVGVQGASAASNANASNAATTVPTNSDATATNIATTATNQATGGGLAHANLPPYLVANMIIKVSNSVGSNPFNFGIAQGNAVKVSAAGVASGQYARFTSTGLEGRTTAQVLGDIGAQASGTTIPIDGLIYGSGTWEYVSAAAPSFVLRVNADITGLFSAGTRLRLLQTTYKWFIVTAMGVYSGGYTPVTIYGGTDYTLTNAAITDVRYSLEKAPAGFPLDPAKWTIETVNLTQIYQASPTNGTWYNLGSLSIAIPVGAWRVQYEASLQTLIAATGGSAAKITLSTGNNNETDIHFSAIKSGYGSGVNFSLISTMYREKHLLIAAATTYYLNAQVVDTNCGYLEIRGDYAATIIRAICAYL
jgi:microcystin-dependent protein